MGTRSGAGGLAAGGGRRRGLLLSALCAVALLLAVTPAKADFHFIKIREVYAGATDGSYVVLQMYAAGQGNLAPSHHVDLYGATGNLVTTFTFSNDAANAQNQATVLVADSGYASEFPSGPQPDATHAALNIPAAGGAICFDSPDCVSWGSFTGSLPSSAGTPESAIPSGMAIRRSISGGACTGQLDATDDTNDSAADFSPVSPQPRNNASAIVESSCSASTAPNTTIGSPKPASRTNSTSATFTFTASPSTEASFECKLDAAAFAACTSPQEYTGLAGGAGTSHTFQVRAVHPTNGKDPTPASHTWVVDTVAPSATIDDRPPDPGPGNSVRFTYGSNEGGSSFQCSLEPLGQPATFSPCPLTEKTYTNVPDGEYTFEVKAKDQAGNEGAADVFSWEVDNSLNDETPPQTTIGSRPPDPSSSSTASFTYSSNEPGSTFECKLDDGGFVACDPVGVAYAGLEDGPHSFQVRARDQAGNLDPSPAAYSWSVALPAPAPPFSAPPPFPALASGSAAARPPQTTIARKPRSRTRDRTPTFRFRSDPVGAGFECRLDRGSFRRCASPFTTKPLGFGRHSLQVRAVADGLADPTPAKSSFRVAKPLRRKGAR